MKNEHSAGAVVFRQDKEIMYLLLHYESKHWDFPKGNIEENEAEQDTVKREIEEETGIKDVKIINGFKEKIQYFFKFETQVIDKTVVFYVAETETEHIKLSFEHIDSIWLAYDDALDKLTFKNAKEILKKANKFIIKHKS